MKRSMIAILMATTFTIASIAFFSCKDDNGIDEEWEELNWKAYTKTISTAEFSAVEVPAGFPKGVYKRVIKEGPGGISPHQTAQVKINYKGYYYDGSVFDAGSSLTGVPVIFPVNGVIRGFSIALQSMRVGDKWEIVIPYFLGYGSQGNIDPYSGAVLIKGYTTLYFEIELLEVEQYPK